MKKLIFEIGVVATLAFATSVYAALQTATAAPLLYGMGANAGCANTASNCNQITIIPDSELELMGVSADHKSWEAPDGTIYQCDGGFYAIEIKGQSTIWCNGKVI